MMSRLSVPHVKRDPYGKRMASVAGIFLCVLLVLSCCLVSDAKKTKPLASPYSKAVQMAIRCETCQYLVSTSFREAYYVLILASERGENFATSGQVAQRQRYAQEEQILASLESICNPFSGSGDWIRRLTIIATPRGVPMLKTSEDYLKCNRSCQTVSAICTSLMEEDDLDDLPMLCHAAALSTFREIQDLKMELGDTNIDSMVQETSLKSVQSLQRKLCDQTCDLQKARFDKLSIPEPELEAIRSETPEKIDEKEMEVEEMIDTMEKAPAAAAEEENEFDALDSAGLAAGASRAKQMGAALSGGGQSFSVLDQQDVQTISKAFVEGDREKLIELDPQIASLSDEEFQALQQMFRDQAGDDDILGDL